MGGDSPTPVELSVDERRSATAHAAEDPAVRYEDEEPRACNCERPEGFTLAVETGGISVVHTACGKQPWFMFNDWTESIEMAPTPVNVDVVTACGPSDHYFEWGVCDCGPEITLTLPPDATAKEVC
ncbi:hypothetical protein [Streptomyces tsukubensis]|uniref:hypothetical protein n=1 Tax=Streptomyces tsukubensis TaxID=83656 RepID=UPI00344B625D